MTTSAGTDPKRPEAEPSTVWLDPDTVRFLERHQANCSTDVARRELIDLGDAFLLHDPLDADPAFNRIGGVRWPEDGTAFEGRLRTVMDVFRALDRRPCFWLSPEHSEPADLAMRLVRRGFTEGRGGFLMILEQAPSQDPLVGLEPGVRVLRLRGGRRPEGELVGAIADALSDAFAIDASARPQLKIDIDDGLQRLPGVSLCVVTVDDGVVAVGKSHTRDGATYLSAIGSRAAFARRGYGSLVTRVLARDAAAAGSRWIYLGVDADNLPARRLYSGLGFATIGGLARDFLLG
jgi:ribosomal protein S18 acetylase RimI-like enzyme